MDQIIHMLSDPNVQGFLLSIATMVITELSKRLHLSPNIVAGTLSAILATIFYVVLETVPQENITDFGVRLVAVYGGATALYKIYKKLVTTKQNNV